MKTFLIALTACLFINLPTTHAFTFNGKTKEELHTSTSSSASNPPVTAPAHEKTSPKRGEFTIGGKPMKTEEKTKEKTKEKIEKKVTHSTEGTTPEMKVTREEKKAHTTATTRPQQQTGGFFGGLFGKKTPKEPSSTRTTTPFSGSVNINTASASELAQLNGIGPAKAAAIIAYRKQHGDFSSVNQLTEVSGIGPATVAKLKKQATVR